VVSVRGAREGGRLPQLCNRFPGTGHCEGGKRPRTKAEAALKESEAAQKGLENAAEEAVARTLELEDAIEEAEDAAEEAEGRIQAAVLGIDELEAALEEASGRF
jgi:chromosome segregation ATPase